MLDMLAAGAAHPAPPWSTAVLILAALWWVGFFMAAIKTTPLRVARRLYWVGTGGAALLAGLAVSHRGGSAVVAVAGFVVVIALLYAATRTPYLKIGDRLIAASVAEHDRDDRDRGVDPQPPAPDDYATSTAGGLWWILFCLTVFAAVGVALPNRDGSPDWWGWVGLALVVVMALGVGILDGRGRFSVARRQWIPAALAAVASIPLYGVPVVLYIAAYLLGRRLPGDWGLAAGRHARRGGHDEVT